MTDIRLGPAPVRRAALRRRVRLLVAATITYNVAEAVVAITAGTVASSGALIAFGLDSVIEVASAAAVAWQFSGRDPEARERVTLRIIALSFFALAAYVTVDSALTLTGAVHTERSTAGIVLATVSLVVMPFLSAAQRRAGRELGSATAVADSRQTLLCTYLRRRGQRGPLGLARGRVLRPLRGRCGRLLCHLQASGGVLRAQAPDARFDPLLTGPLGMPFDE